jgi:hypothetical protein
VREGFPSIRRFYGLLLNLYPRNYRREFGEELQAVFALSLADAAKLGNLESAKVWLRELFALPQGIYFEHLRERRKTGMTKKLASPVSETISVIIPFLVVLALYFPIGMIQGIPARVVGMFRLSLFGILLVMFFVGLARGLPRGMLPLMGFVFAVANLFITFAIIDPKWPGFSFPPFVPRFVRDYIQGWVFFGGIVILVFLSVLLAAVVPAFRPFYRRLRNDWTLLAFIFYGTTPFAIFLTFDDYQYAGPYVFVSFIILAFGGWLYLYNEAPWKKFMILFTGLTLAMAVTVTGAAVLVEKSLYAPFATWQTAMLETIMTWTWLATFMLLPPLINLLPQLHNTSRNSSLS